MRGIGNKVYICTLSRQWEGCDIYITKLTNGINDGDEGVNMSEDFNNKKRTCLLVG